MGRAVRAPALGLPLLLALALITAGCEEPLTDVEWTAFPDTVVLYSLARPELDRQSAFNFNVRTPVRLEAPGATGEWDVALDTRGNQLVLLPPGALGVTSRARVLQVAGQTFDQVVEAPADTMLYSATLPVPVQLGSTYVVRTDFRTTPFGSQCIYFAKLEPLKVDVAAGTLEFVYDVSPVCNDRRLVPPDTDGG
jgi:hypothetical protein